MYKFPNQGRVLYTNGLALIPLMFAVPILESKMLAEIQLTALTVFVIALSCILGIGMSFLSFKVNVMIFFLFEHTFPFAF